MKTKKYFMAILIAGTSFLFSCTENSGNSEKSPNGQIKEQVTFQCPMKCEGEKTYDKAGSCPVCNMNLEKVEHHEHSEHQH